MVGAGVRPERACWQGDDLFAAPVPIGRPAPAEFNVPRAFVELAESVCMHRDSENHALLYSILWRLLHGEPLLLQRASDAQVARANGMAREVRRAIHKMRAFVRFREQAGRHVAWFEPAHHVARANAPFFARRFAQMDWSILTPDVSLHWTAAAARLVEGPGATRADAPADDAHEELWRTYYASIFNPARLKVGMMKSEMPVRYWRNLPEAEQITSLIRSAGTRTQRMIDRDER